MKINGYLDMNSVDIVGKRGLNDGGLVQKYIDETCIDYMEPYTPAQSKFLANSATLNTVIGSGIIHQNAPQGRYLYYGELMVSSVTGSSYASAGETKVLTGIDLKYSRSVTPLAGKMWFERMVSDRKEDILEGAQQVANRGGK